MVPSCSLCSEQKKKVVVISLVVLFSTLSIAGSMDGGDLSRHPYSSGSLVHVIMTCVHILCFRRLTIAIVVLVGVGTFPYPLWLPCCCHVCTLPSPPVDSGKEIRRPAFWLHVTVVSVLIACYSGQPRACNHSTL